MPIHAYSNQPTDRYAVYARLRDERFLTRRNPDSVG